MPRADCDRRRVRVGPEGGNIPSIWARANGTPTRLIGITWLDEYQALVSGPGSSVRQAADLRGKRIGLQTGSTPVVDVALSSSLRGAERALSTAGLSLDDLTLARHAADQGGQGEKFGAVVRALLAGEVDAVWVKGAGGFREVREHGLTEVVRLDQSTDPLVRVNAGTPRTITVRQELVDSSPDLVRAYLATITDAVRQIGTDRERLWTVLSRETYESVADAEVAYSGVTEISLVPSLAPDRRAALQHQADFLYQHGFIPSRVDVDEWILDLAA